MRRWTWFGLLLLVSVVFVASTAAAHPVGKPLPGHQRVLADCYHDYGHHGDKPHLKGHEFLALDVAEKEVDGEMMVVVYVPIHQKFQGAGTGALRTPADPDYEMRDVLTFKSPRQTIETVLRSTGDHSWRVESGATPFVREGLVHYNSEAQIQDGVDVPDEARYAIELAYTYAQLDVRNGETLRDFQLVGHVQLTSGGAWTKGDYLPGTYYDPTLNGDGTACASYTTHAAHRMPAGEFPFEVKLRPPADPVASFTMSLSQTVTGQVVSFTDASSDPDGTITAWAWSFGDGATSTTRHPTHAYTSAGTYTVTLAVTDNGGRTASATRTISVTDPSTHALPRPDFTFNPPSPLSGESVSFTDASQHPGGTLVAWSWSFGDGNASTSRHPTHTYARPGNYTVNLTVRDQHDAQQTVSKLVAVQNRLPLALIVALAEAKVGEPVDFSDASTDPDGRIVRREWRFGDGGTSTLAETSHVYAAPGNYTVTLEVTDELGAASTTSHDLRVGPAEVVLPRPAFRFEPSSPRTGDMVAFHDESTHEAGVIVAWQWTFGDEAVADVPSPTHAYERPGTYEVVLRVRDDKGILNETRAIVPVANRPPSVRFIEPETHVVMGEAFRPRVEAMDPDGEIVSWSWDFGDGTLLTGAQAENAYRQPGTYAVRLVVTDDSGGMAEAVHTLEVHVPQDHASHASGNATHGHEDEAHAGRDRAQEGVASPASDKPLAARFSHSPPSPRVGEPIRFQDASEGAVTSWRWSFGDGASLITQSPTYDFAAPGIYTVTLTVYDAAGRSSSTSREVNVLPPSDGSAASGLEDPSADLELTQVPTPSEGKNATPGADIGLLALLVGCAARHAARRSRRE